MLGWASAELRRDPSLICAFLRYDSSAVLYAAETLARDREFVLLALTVNPQALAYLQDFQGDRQMVRQAVLGDGSNLCYGSEELRMDQDAVQSVSTACGSVESCMLRRTSC